MEVLWHQQGRQGSQLKRLVAASAAGGIGVALQDWGFMVEMGLVLDFLQMGAIWRLWKWARWKGLGFYILFYFFVNATEINIKSDKRKI